MFEEEIQQILKSVVNIKHKAILSTIYAGGLRIGELIKLPIKAIDSKQMQIRIEGGKGKKDRYTILSKKDIGTSTNLFQGIQPTLLPV